MSKLVTFVGGGSILMGLFMAASPEQFFSLLDWESRTGQYVAAAIRVGFGLILILGASVSRYPTGFRIFGGLILLIGLALPFVPLELWSSLIRWVTSGHSAITALVRVGGVGAMVIGAFLIYAVWPEESDD